MISKIVYYSRKNQNIIFIILTLLTTGLYAGILCNQLLPLSEGWYTYYAKCINEKNLMPYKDFEYLYSPLYLLFIAIITRIWGYNLIVLRYMGVIMFCIIAIGVYLVVQLIVGQAKSWIAYVAAVTSCFYMQSEVVQVFYDYVRFMDIISIFTVFFLLKTVKKMSLKTNYISNLLLTGILCGLLINIKQNIGLVFSVFVIILLIYLAMYYRDTAKTTIKNLIVFSSPLLIINGIIYLFMAISGCLSYYIKATGVDAINAKGGIVAILLNWIPNNWNAFVAAFPFARNVLMIIIIVFIGKLFLAKKFGERAEDASVLSWGLLFFALTFLFLILIKNSISFAKNIYSQNSLSPYAIFMIIFPIFVILGLWGIINIIKRNNSMDKYILLFTLSGAYFAIAYSCGNSGGISEGQSTIGVALLITIFFLLFNYKIEKFITMLILFMCFSLTIQTAEKKMLYTYNWWGMDESNFWESCKPATIPLIKNIGLSTETNTLYEEIYNLVIENTTKEDSIFCFPQIPIFYVLCDRDDPGTRSKVQWFDVSTDDTLIQDIEIIRNNKPKVIIMYNTSAYAYQSHENAFRKGNISGTKIMREFLYNFVYENQYTFAGRFCANANIVQVWILDHENSYQKSVFSGGDGTVDNPYLIENAEQLVNLSCMVNDGRSFEGMYIKQIKDIDLSSVERWESIGKFGSDTAFYGTYDGAGHVIKNLNTYSTEDDYNLGLFGQLGGRVYNLGVEGGMISGGACGGIASHSIGGNASIINCYTNIDIKGLRAGGIADNFTGVIKNCFSIGNLEGIESADVISYCANMSCDIDRVYLLNNTCNSLIYNASLHDKRINLCEKEYFKSDIFVQSLNNWVNGINHDEHEIKQISWIVGESGYPIFDAK